MQHPRGKKNEPFSTHIRAKLFYSSGDMEWRSRSVEAVDQPGVGGDAMWDEKVSWDFEEDDLAFVV